MATSTSQVQAILLPQPPNMLKLMTVNPFEIFAAAKKAVCFYKLGEMKSGALSTEIIFNLSPNSNISEALKKCGISANDPLILIVYTNKGAKQINQGYLMPQVEGQQVSLKNLPEIINITKVEKKHKFPPQEENIGNIVGWYL
ncbi:EKC/KEOPS complex subunit TPRKB-like [Piliocolobus tephrosceles]|uniref:EKC/KEOPS complex subunit TPRKB-like n=1 Tax=Piliocolobus tephrosceles TaxID=591936 RepID=UPI000C2AC936|nr:EKC/KEOPS complex subunit TPRKB-like [Piliocolobus tephrosceles]